MRNFKFLGQVAISPNAGFGGGISPWGVGAMPSGWNYRNSQGGPLMSEEIVSPEHAYEEKHCYRSPAGDYVSIPLGEREGYLAAGYVAVDVANCSPSLSGRRGLGQTTPTPTIPNNPAPAAPAPKLNTPVVLGITTATGAILGYALSFLPPFTKGKSKAEVSSMSKFGALGGAIGGAAAVGTMLLLKS